MIAPLNGGVRLRRHNKTLHGRSVYRPRDVPGHNVVLGYSRPGTGDALDIFVPAGTPVYGMHSGRVTRVADRSGRLSCIYIEGGGTISVYAHIHIRESIVLGSMIREGDVIGWVGRVLADPHLHLEVWSGGRALSGKTPLALAQAITNLYTKGGTK